jgi:hypothetical protein
LLRRLWRFVPVVKKQIQERLESSGEPFKRVERGNHVTILHPRNVAAEQSRAFFEVALAKLLILAQFADAVADHRRPGITSSVHINSKAAVEKFGVSF